MHSVSDLLKQLEDNQSLAAHQLWELFIERLIVAARRHLGNLPRRAVDEEDVAIAAFEAFLRGAKEGRFKKLDNRNDLWQVLAMLTERKAIGLMRQELADKRGGGTGRGESVFEKMIQESSAGVGIDQVSDPNQETLEVFTLEVRELLDGLGDKLLKQIAMLKLEGYTSVEIAQQLNIALRSVERKLQLIRGKWGETTT
jgi:RNA polymerase sigma factor (sigma-70 family)